MNTPNIPYTQNIASKKSYAVAVCLSGIFGIIGIHHFYVGRILHGLIDFGMFVLTIYLFTQELPVPALVVLFIDYLHTIIVTILLLIGAYKDGSGRIIAYPGQRLN